jgi:enoyl-CoA hydratase/carnithine racemase
MTLDGEDSDRPAALATGTVREGSMAMADEVLRERRGHVEILTINRPEARNAINGGVSRAMSAAMDELADDDECWVVVITGSGDKAFSAGMDLKAFTTGEGGDIMGAPGGFAGLTQRSFPKPIIAAVNGSALAGGLEIMLSCDLVVAVEHAMFGIPEAKRGLIAGAGGLLRLPKRLPIAVALELAMTGDPIDARRAEALGLVNKVVPAESLLAEALALAERIAANAPLAVRYSKSVMQRAAEVPESEGWQINQEAVGVVFSSADAREGPVAFAEKREPHWQGK